MVVSPVFFFIFVPLPTYGDILEMMERRMNTVTRFTFVFPLSLSYLFSLMWICRYVSTSTSVDVYIPLLPSFFFPLHGTPFIIHEQNHPSSLSPPHLLTLLLVPSSNFSSSDSFVLCEHLRFIWLIRLLSVGLIPEPGYQPASQPASRPGFV